MPEIFALDQTTNQLDSEFSGAAVPLPAQIPNRRNRATALEPLRRLMVAVLVDAIRCVQTRFSARQPVRRQEYTDARSWIFSGDDRAVFSFKTICDALEIDPNAIRKYVLQWEKKRRSGEQAQLIICRQSYRRRSEFHDNGGKFGSAIKVDDGLSHD
jgi:hypothetical protein